jgi:hypothetical protein
MREEDADRSQWMGDRSTKTAPRLLDAERARRVSQEMAGSSPTPDRAGIGASRHRWARVAQAAAPCLLAAAMAAALAHGPRQGHAHFRPEESGDSVAQEMAADGSLRGMNTRSTSIVPVAAAAAIASNLLAVPPGYVLVADSQAQFSGVQGQDGWWYLFDRGPGTGASQVSHFVPFAGAMAWCTATVAGNGGSHCIISAIGCHPNTASNCNTTATGDQRPIREWRPIVPAKVVAELTGVPNPISPGMRIDLLGNGAVVSSWTSINGSVPSINAMIDLGVVASVGVLLDAIGSCHMDSFEHSLRIYAQDCDDDFTPDYLQTAGDPGLDLNQDGLLDSCQCAQFPALCCPADLNRDGQVNGADIGAVLAFWGPNPAFPAADIDRSGAVDGADLGALLAAWGPCGP